MKKMLFVMLLLAIPVLLIMDGAFADYEGVVGHHMYWMGYGGLFYGPWMMVFFWALLVFLVAHLMGRGCCQ